MSKKIEIKSKYIPDKWHYNKSRGVYLAKDNTGDLWIMIDRRKSSRGMGATKYKNPKQQVLFDKDLFQYQDGLFTDKNKNFTFINTKKYRPSIKLKPSASTAAKRKAKTSENILSLFEYAEKKKQVKSPEKLDKKQYYKKKLQDNYFERRKKKQRRVLKTNKKLIDKSLKTPMISNISQKILIKKLVGNLPKLI